MLGVLALAKWYQITVKFRGAAHDRNDAIQKARELFADLPLHNLEFDAAEMGMSGVLKQIDSEDAKRQIEADTDQGVSFTEMIGGSPRVTHPWDQGLWIFPEGHPMRRYEEKAKLGDESAQRVLDRAIEEAKNASIEEGRRAIRTGSGTDQQPETDGGEPEEGRTD